MLHFECVACNGDFDMDFETFVEELDGFKCPNCKVTPDRKKLKQFFSALEDLIEASAEVRKKFRHVVSVESDDLPPPYGGSKETDEEAWNESDDLEEYEDEEENEEYDEFSDMDKL